ncbi:MAG: hypothetical protein R3F29_10385 [Planctomycetota bacterium]
MNRFANLSLAAAALAVATAAQSPNMLLTYSQPEQTLSGSGGTVLSALRPDEVAYLDFASGPCPGASAEKWLPRTASHTMLGDEDGDGLFFNPNIFGRIDALLSNVMWTSPIGLDNQRTIYWSVSQPIGNNVSLTPFRPGDVAHIVRAGVGDGQVEHFMRQEQFNQALGLPIAYGIDIDAVAFGPNFGVYFSVDVDVPANTACGPTLVRDGDVLCIPPWALTFTTDMRIASVVPNSAVVVYTEAAMNAFTANAQVTDRFGVCVGAIGDLEALEFDQFGPMSTVFPVPGMVLTVPTLVYSSENGTGASLLSTAFGGSIHNTLCGPAGTSCGSGPTMGMQLGIQPASTAVGAPSFVNGLCFARSTHHVLEPQQHVMNVFPFGAPAGAIGIDYGSEHAWNLALIEIPSPVVPMSFPAFPFSQFCFPDLYAPSISVHAWPLPGTWGTFPMIAIPAGWSGKVLYQNIGFSSWGTLELSTPCVIDVQ